MGLCEEDFFVLHFDEIEHGLRTDHPLFQDLDRGVSDALLEAVADEPPDEPVGSEEKSDESDEREEHLDERSADVAGRRRNFVERLGLRKRSQLAVFVGDENFRGEFPKHAFQYGNWPISFKEKNPREGPRAKRVAKRSSFFAGG